MDGYKLLLKYENSANIPEDVCEALADKLGGYEASMIRAIAIELEERTRTTH